MINAGSLTVSLSTTILILQMVIIFSSNNYDANKMRAGYKECLFERELRMSVLGLRYVIMRRNQKA
jgi:hypothetical protein